MTCNCIHETEWNSSTILGRSCSWDVVTYHTDEGYKRNHEDKDNHPSEGHKAKNAEGSPTDLAI